MLQQTQIVFTLFIFIGILWYAIIFFRPDIVDKENRVRSVPKLLAEYDYIVIGGGSAGAVVASRLSEDQNHKVLLLEAGGDEIVLSDVPAIAMLLQRTSFDWSFQTEPSSNYCLAMNNHQCRWPRGKVLGGSSVLNTMLYVRGNRRDYDSWAALGNTGWDYQSVLPYFKKSEDARTEELADSPYHRKGGYLSVERFKYEAPIVDYILRSGEELGYRVHDVNADSQTGFTHPYGTLRDGLRCSTAKAFLRPASKRNNLHVSLESFVEKILFRQDGTSKAAYGVTFRRNGQRFTIRARCELILSAGAIQSPQLLMLSGIGPREHLEELGIPVVHHAPGVGRNLQDHVGIGGLLYTCELPPDTPDLIIRLPGILNIPSFLAMMRNNSGPLSTTYWNYAFINTKYADDAIDYPDVQLLFLSFSDQGVISSYYVDINSDVSTDLYRMLEDSHILQIYPLILRPRSRGFIKLKSTDPYKAPTIVPNYFDDPRDLQILVEGVRFIKRLMRTSTMRKLKARLNSNKISECAQFELSSDEYWLCHSRYYTTTIYHPSGTCKMGPRSDSHAVVDARLRVHGVTKLRVIDASIMPHIVSGNTNAPTIMIAEKGADMIKEDWSI